MCTTLPGLRWKKRENQPYPEKKDYICKSNDNTTAMQDCTIAETDIIRIPSGTLARHAITQTMRKYRWWFCAAPAVSCLLAVSRWEWLIVGLALCLIVYPFVVMTVYFGDMLDPCVAIFTRPVKISFTADTMICRFYETSQNDKEAPQHQLPVNEKTIPIEDIKRIWQGQDSIRLYIRHPKPLCITILDRQWQTPVPLTPQDCRLRVMGLLRENGTEFVQ
ncbi:MAG: hypothetical protein J1F20_02865 [Muribaculaceae bacterium]|nr:hypothetical protein [Muribaculaceae bacterium]